MAEPLQDLVAQVLDVSRDAVTDELGPATEGKWTSLNHVRLVSAAQRAYQVRLSPREMRSIRTVGDLRQLLHDKGAHPDG